MTDATAKPISITATFPYDLNFSADPDTADRERAEFMERAEAIIIVIALPEIDDTVPENADEILRCLDLESADVNDKGFTVPVRDRACADRLLNAGLLDQTHWEIIQRWGAVHPMNPAPGSDS